MNYPIIDFFSCVLENLAVSITSKMGTARFVEPAADSPLIIQCNHKRMKEYSKKHVLEVVPGVLYFKW